MTGNSLVQRAPSAIAEIEIDYGKVLQHLGLNPADPKAQALVLVCRQYHLDPVLKHAILISEGKKGEASLYVTHKGLIHVAHRSGDLDVITIPEQGETDTHWTAVAEVWRTGRTRPFRYPGRYPKMRPVYEWTGPEGKRVKKKIGEELHPYGPEMAIKAAECMALRRAFDVQLPVAEERWDVDDGPSATTVTQMSGPDARSRRSEGLTDRATTGPDQPPGGAADGALSRPAGTTVADEVHQRTGLSLVDAADLLNDHRGDKRPTTPGELATYGGQLREQMIARLEALQAELVPPAVDSLIGSIAADTPDGEQPAAGRVATLREQAQAEIRGEAL